ncbi:MAG: hypothetical protein KKF89_03625, partial [Nanoarchaeota archaeon]|nr:hypothetical protein [Nanoarchaeota archaeon]
MAAKKKELHKAVTIDDYMSDYFGDLDEAFKHYDAHMDEKVQANLRANVFLPAQQEMYNTISSELKKEFKDDDASIYGKKKELKSIAVKGLLKFFEKAGYKGIEEKIKDLEADDQYERLISLYDSQELNHQGRDDLKNGLYSIRLLIDGHAKDKKATVLTLKDALGSQMVLHTNRLQSNYTFKRSHEKLGKYESRPDLVGDYLKGKFKERGSIDISDKNKFQTHKYETLIDMRNKFIKG